MPHLTRSRGRRQASRWGDPAWRKQKRYYAVNTGLNYWLHYQASPVDRRGRKSGHSGESSWAPLGTWFSRLRTGTLVTLDANIGPTGSFKQLTKGALGGARQPHDPLSGAPLRTPARRWLLGRSRSMCAVRFQALPTQHPLGPYLRIRRRFPNAAHPRPNPCRSDLDSGHFAVSCWLPPTVAQGGALARHASEGRYQANTRSFPKPRRPPNLKHHPSSHPQTLSQAGPKSGCCLPLSVMLMIHSIEGAVGVRVASIAAVEAGPGATPGKHCSKALSMPLTQAVPKHSEKRAYRRARLRAARVGGTYYRGRWHSAASLQTLPYTPITAAPRSTPRRAQRRTSTTPMLHCISWNAGGLNAGLYQELIAWLEVQNKYQVCVVQETHWSASSEYFSGKWVCVHSAPAPADATTDRYAGLLILLSRAYFQDPAVHEVIGGRVVHVRAKPKHSDVSLDIVATYQHVWRSQLSTQENSRLRDSVWDALDATLCSLPSRNILFACGDYNTNLRPQPPHVGNAVGPVTSASKLDSRLPQLLERHDLCALNSWHARPLHTYYGHTGYSQIDYIITRRNTATGTSRQARPLHQFPVAGWRLAGHLPIEAQLPMLPVHWRPGRPQHSTQPVDKARLLEAATSCNEDAMALRALVAAKLQDLPVTDPHALHTRVNQILQQCVRQAFPPPQAADGRVSAQAPFRASAKHTWHLYALLRRPRVATIAAMLHKWKLHLAFARASRALRQQSKDLKRAAFAGKLMQAEEAAQRGDQRTLFQIVRSLTPSPGRAFSRLRDDEGRLLSKRAEVLALVEQGQATYAQHDDRPLSESLPEALVLTDAEITVQLEATKAAKAVPSHLAPAAAWKLCASLLGPIFGTSFRHHFAQGSSGHLHGDLADAQMIMLPKVGKSPHVLGNLRPIGLMGPPSKALAGALRDRMLEQLTQLVTQRPQFAYTAGRGTLNALLRIHMHVAEANTLLRSQHISRFGMHAGRRPLPLAGALSLSLDLSRAFDLADRCSIYCTLEKYQVPRAVIDVVQRLHTGAQFVYQAGAHTAAFVPTNGLKQGCKVAPCLWVWYTVALFDTLEERLSEAWVRHTPTMFADDCWAHWIIKSSSDLQRALKELQILLCTLEDYRMRINFSKTAILLKLVGKQAHQALRDCTRLKQGVPHLVVSVHGRTQLIPIKTEHEYLGSKVSYHNVADRNLDHRLQAGQLRYHSIQTSLTGRHAITQAHRIRLWAACVFTSTAYSLAAVGVTAQGLQKWETRALKHLRAIMRKPAHLTRVTNAAIWQQAGLRRPGEQLLDQIQQARAKLEIKARLAPDITTDAGVLRYLYQHEVHLRLLLQREQDRPSPPTPAPQHVCPHCEAVFLTLHALHIHCGIKHPNSTEEAGKSARKYTFDPAQHSVGGLPHCRACGRKFTKWQYLKHHIEVGACVTVGGASFVHKPTAEVELRAELQPPTQPPLASQEPQMQNLPLVQRPFFQAAWARWESLLSNAALRQELQAHCVLCHFWVADHQHIKQHQRRVHWDIVHPLQDSVTSICRSFKSQLSSGRNCPWCARRVWAPARHAAQCPVLTQLVLAARYCQQQAARDAERPSHGSDTLKTLTKVIIRQEDQLAELRGDKGFCLFLREDPEVSIIPALIQISKDWHARQEARDSITDGLSHPPTAGTHGAHDLHPGIGEKASGGGLDESSGGVDLLQVESPGEEARPGCGQGGHSTAGAAGEGGLPVGKPPGRRGPEVHLPPENLRDGEHQRHDGDLLPLHLPAGTGGPAGARAPGADDRSVGADVGGGLSQERAAAKSGDRAAAGGGSFSLSLQERHAMPPPPPFSLRNDSNDCYMNVIVYALWHVTHRTGTAHLLPRMLATLSGPGLRARRSLGFLLLGWRGARRQHDTAEFIDFLIPKVASTGVSTWSSRTISPSGEVRTLLTGTLNKCLGLPATPVHTPELQELINHWHQQESLHALDVTPPWLFVQLPRFAVAAGAVRKTQHPYLLAGTVQIPFFCEPGTLRVAWRVYDIACYIRHHGPTPYSGHYTVLIQDASPYLLDDDRPPASASAAELEDTSVSAYILVLCQRTASAALLAPSTPLGPSCSHVGLAPTPHAGDRKLNRYHASDARDLAKQSSRIPGDVAPSCDDGCSYASAAARPVGDSHPKVDNPSAADPDGARTEQGSQ